ncbi:MAG: 16S rRNA (guanine(966)-N(2))-methyltransferase RsmD [Terriglobales bacterium]
MRVIAGRLRRRPLAAPAGLRLRPTSDALRETLFNILGPEVAGSVFVDAYAGTGAVGIEALSRGASRVVFMERDPVALHALRSNLRDLALLQDPAVQVLALEVARGLLKLNSHPALQAGAGFIFLDPPYAAATEYARTLDALGRNPTLIGAHTRVIAEHAARAPLATAFGELVLTRTVEQGDSCLSFFARRGAGAVL